MTVGLLDDAILDQASKAVTSLIKYETGKAKKASPDKKPSLFESDDSLGLSATHLWVIIGLNKVAEKRQDKPIRISLPKPWIIAETADANVCLITKDPQRAFKDLINPLGVKSISKIVGVSKLKTKYKPFEVRRQLCNAYDIFLADECVLPLLPKLLGKSFYEKKKLPLPVNLKKKSDSLKMELKDAIESTVMNVSAGPCISIKFGRADQPGGDLLGNLKHVLDRAAQKIPGGWGNIRSIHIKSATSVSLPVYVPQD